MSGVAPESAVEHLAAVVGIGLEARQLPVPDGLEEQTDAPDTETEDVERPQRRLLRLQQRDLHRQGNEPLQNSLQGEHREEAQPPEPAAVMFAHRRVAEILAVPEVSARQIDSETETPERHHGEHH